MFLLKEKQFSLVVALINLSGPTSTSNLFMASVNNIILFEIWKLNLVWHKLRGLKNLRRPPMSSVNILKTGLHIHFRTYFPEVSRDLNVESDCALINCAICLMTLPLACEFGDQSSSCATYFPSDPSQVRKSICYTDQNRDICCGSCSTYRNDDLKGIVLLLLLAIIVYVNIAL